MEVINKVKIDLLKPGVKPIINAMQADENSRVLKIDLNANGSAWEIPDGASFSMAYKKPDGTRGLYDTLPDGSSASSVDGNVVSIRLAPQMLTVAGTVTASVIIASGDQRISTFPIIVNVIQNPAVGADGSEDYFYSSVIGNLDDLKTTDKSSVVAAINEIFRTGGSDSGQNADKLVLKSPDGTVWNITVSNDGVITATRATEDGGEETVTFTIPVVNLTGDLTGISGDDYVNVICHYLDSVNTVEFTDYAEIAYQGSSSMNFTNVEDGVDKAKNYKIKLYTDEARETKSKRVFKDWFATNNFHIKCNFGDCTNFMNNMMMHYLRKSYQYLTPLPREGAMYTVDGFPILLYINGVFCGIRFWNLKQDDKVYNLKDENDLCYQIGLNNGSSSGDNSGAFVYGNLNSGSNAGKVFADAHAEIDYYWEDRAWDKTGNHPAVLYNTIQWVSEATDNEFKANLEQYFDKEYLINYFINMYTWGMGDSICKNFNMLYFPDTGKWYATWWDMDFACGVGWQLGTTPYTIDVLSSAYGASRLFTKLWANFKAEIVATYWEMRETVLTVEQLEDSINAVWGAITSDMIASNKAAKYDGTSYGGFKTDGVAYVLNWATNRLSHVDSIMEKAVDVLTTAITLDADTLTFTTTDTQKLTATVTPENSTQSVVWTSSDNNVATVVDGIVTPVGKGACVITATSGDYSDTCAVTVNIKVVSYTAGYINDSGEIGNWAGHYVCNEYDDVSGADAIEVSVHSPVDYIHVAQYDSNKAFIRRMYVKASGTSTKFALDENAAYVRVGFGPVGTDVATIFANYSVTAVDGADKSAGYINDSGVLTAKDGSYVSNKYDTVTGGASITVAFTGSGINIGSGVSTVRVAEYDANKNFVKRAYSAGGTFTLGADTAYIRVGFDFSNTDEILIDTVLLGYTITES